MRKGRPEFGQRINASGYVVKTRRWDSRKGDVVTWEHRTYPVEGLYIGFRDVFEGVTNYFEDHSEFHMDKKIRVWMIVQHERKNPIRILPSDVIENNS